MKPGYGDAMPAAIASGELNGRESSVPRLRNDGSSSFSLNQAAAKTRAFRAEIG